MNFSSLSLSTRVCWFLHFVSSIRSLGSCLVAWARHTWWGLFLPRQAGPFEIYGSSLLSLYASTVICTVCDICQSVICVLYCLCIFLCFVGFLTLSSVGMSTGLLWLCFGCPLYFVTFCCCLVPVVHCWCLSLWFVVFCGILVIF